MLVILGMETIVMFITWLIVLIAGRMPRTLYEAIAAGLRYYIRFTGYLFLVTATYPWGLFGDEASQPAEGTGWLGGNQPWRLVLSTASSASQYRQIEASIGLNPRLYRFAAEVRGLDGMLGVA